MKYSNEAYMRAQYNLRVLREVGVESARAYQEADLYAGLGIDILGVDFRGGKMFLKLCRDGEDGRPYEVEFHLGRSAA
jgi:hypothetical protein